MNAVTIVGVVSAFGLVFLWLLALCVEKGVYPFRRVRHGFSCLPAWEKALLSIFVGVWIAFASVKDGTNGVSQVEGGTNVVTQVEGTNTVVQTDDGAGTNGIGTVGVPLMLGLLGHPNFTQGQLPSITDNDITLGWRMAATTGAGPLAVPTANAVTNLDWRDYGGLSDSLRIKPEGWRFPYGDKTTTGLTVFENGDFRTNVKTHFFPQPFDANLSLLPRKNWGLLPDGGESVFWHEQTASNSLVLTWHNALYNRDVSCPTNFQAELFADGRFDYRYPDRIVQYVPVFPFDWDGDGLENSVDPEPLVPGPDAHGSNAEWYNVVCSNVFAAVEGTDGIVFSPRSGEINTNAYFFVDVVAESLAPVYFIADGVSRLGNPIVVARAGETNHVPLLIGATYCISSSVPLTVFAPVNAVLESRWAEGFSLFDIVWPSGLDYERDGDFYYPTADEWTRLGGEFSWTGGCCLRLQGDAMSFGCHGCGCGGCSPLLNYSYEGYTGSVLGPTCGCTGHSSQTVTPFITTDANASLGLGFDRQFLVISETNECVETVVPSSTRTTLTLSVNGGTHGGQLFVQTVGFDKLRLVEGTFPDPLVCALSPNETYSLSVVYEGKNTSDRNDDIRVSATFVENETQTRIQRNAKLTVCSFAVAGIAFNHSPAGYTADAINIRQNATTPFDLSQGEWTERGTTNYPACYVGGTLPMVKVRFRARPDAFAAQAMFRAESVLGTLRDLPMRTATFVGGRSGWIEFPLSARIPVAVDRFNQTWSWKVSQVNGTDSSDFDMTTTGPHRIYVTLAHPDCPWRAAALSQYLAWTNVLEFACGVAYGQNSPSTVLAVLSRHLFENMGYVYADSGLAQYSGANYFDLTGYLMKTKTSVNCNDQANALQACSAILGVKSTTCRVRPFGYLNPVNVVGVSGLCNNPGASSSDVLRPVDDLSRTQFYYHCFVRTNGMVYDACMGPVCGMEFNAYLQQYIDCSTPNEKNQGYFSDVQEIQTLRIAEDGELLGMY
ncbi:MAG: hypothetical protein MJ249_08480 [Kiritimatiellae bacterium]|nr:hypothetical protein [Kiritimatiellia bacterium]